MHARMIIVTGQLRRETCGSIRIALLKDMVKTQAGSNTSKQVWHRRDTRVILKQAWVDRQQT